MNIVAAVVAGFVGTLLFTAVLLMAPRMGVPKMDIVGMLSTMFGKANGVSGWTMHLMMGVIFALLYAFLWSRGILAPTVLGGLVFGAGHWLIVGMIMGMIPLMHAGIRSGTVKAPGLWMTNHGGLRAFLSGLMGHMIFGVAVALIYSIV